MDTCVTLTTNMKNADIFDWNQRTNSHKNMQLVEIGRQMAGLLAQVALRSDGLTLTDLLITVC